MKNAICFGVIAVCTALISSGSANAATLGGGGGKTSSKARVIMTNIGQGNSIGIAAWVRPAGTDLPKTMGELRSQLIYMGPGETRQTNKLKNGEYELAIVDAANTAYDDDTELPNPLPAGFVIGNEEFTIDGKDRTVTVSGRGIGFTN